jgi:rhodanese-related sulfurtransferase
MATLATLLLAPGATAMEDKAGDTIERITVDELKSKIAKGERVVIIDVRGGDYETSTTRILGAIRIAPSELQSRLGDIPRDREVVTYCACATDGGAVKAAQTLLANGFKRVRALKGGWTAWNQAGGQVEQKEAAASK